MKYVMLLITGIAIGGLGGHLWTAGPSGSISLDAYPSADAIPRSTPEARPMPDAVSPAPQDDRSDARPRPAESPVDAEPSADGIITGTIVATNGEPVAGAIVRAEPVAADRADGHDDADDEGDAFGGSLDEYLRRAEAAYRRRARHRVATATADGRFAIQGVGGGAHRIHAHADGYDLVGQSASIVRAGAFVRLTARPMATLALEVRADDGTPVDAATVTIRHRRGEHTHAWTPATNTVRVEVGEVTCRAVTADACVTDEVRVALSRGAAAETVRLVAVRSGAIHGHVDGAVGSGDAFVWWMPWSVAGEPDRETMRRGTRIALSPADAFAFRIPSLGAGAYAVGAGRSDAGPDVVRVVTVADRPVESTLTIPKPDAAHYVRVRVLSSEGTETDVPIVATGVECDGRVTKHSGFECLAPGLYLVPHPPRDEDGAGRCFVEAIDRDGVATRAAYRPGRDPEVTLRFAARADVVVTVSGAEPALRDRLEMWITGARTEGGSQTTSTKRFDAHAGIGKTRVEPGRYEIAVTIDENHGQREIARRTVDLATGANDVRLDLPVLHDLVVHGPPNGVIVLVGGDDAPVDGGNFDPRGQLRLRWIEAGDYELRDQTGSMNVRVPSGGPVTFAPRPMNAVRVVIDDRQGPLARLGFENGDVIVGANGKRFTQAGEFNGAFGAAGATALMVVRSGRDVQLMFDPRALGGASMGGSFKPIAR